MAEINAPLKYYDYGIPQTKQFEGYRDKTYIDTTGNPTIGYGFNLNDKNMRSKIPLAVLTGLRPLNKDEADKIFLERYNQAAKDAVTFFGANAMAKLDPQRQAILVDMAYNLGENLPKFKTLKAAVQEGNNQKAAAAMMNSRWYKQTGNRAKHHVLKFGSK